MRLEKRRVGRVVYGARLESVWVKTRRGSNPLPSAFFNEFHCFSNDKVVFDEEKLFLVKKLIKVDPDLLPGRRR